MTDTDMPSLPSQTISVHVCKRRTLLPQDKQQFRCTACLTLSSLTPSGLLPDDVIGAKLRIF